MRCSIITAYYRNEGMTYEWLLNIRDKIGPDDEVIVVNAGSAQIPLDRFNSQFKRIDLPENKSFSNSMNAGIKASTGDYVIIIGNDTFPQTDNWLDRLIHYQTLTGAAIVAPNNTRPGYDTYVPLHMLKDFGEYSTFKMFPAICWLIPRAVIDTVGLFDEQFLIGTYEDNDYCHRVRKEGGSIICAKEVMVDHLLSQTVGKFFDTGKIMQENLARYKAKWNLP